MMQAHIIGLDDIVIGPRKRSLNESKVAALEASIAAVGLLQPVVITDTYALIAGRHRIEAARRLGWVTIPARVMNLDGLRAELAEIDENLTRNELTVLEQGEHLQRRNEILEALGLRAQVGQGRPAKNSATVALFSGDETDHAQPMKTTADLADEIGISKRSAQERLQVVRSLAPDVKDEIAATPLADRTTDLVDLARLDADEQRAVVAMDGVKEGRTSVRFARRKLGEQRARERAEERNRPDAFLADGRPVRLIVGDAEHLDLPDRSVDVIITSPPYNLRHESWPMGGHGRVERTDGIGYDDNMEDAEYQAWQLRVLGELYRVAKSGASLFYNHKTRTRGGALQHPMTWLCRVEGWTIRQEIIWDREVTHNHSATLFWPVDERIYWLVKGGSPTLDGAVGMPTVWRFHGPQPHTWHPAPFVEELPRRCLHAVGGATRKGLVVLDPFAGSCTTLKVALDMGHEAIGVDCNAAYLEQAREHYGW